MIRVDIQTASAEQTNRRTMPNMAVMFAHAEGPRITQLTRHQPAVVAVNGCGRPPTRLR